MPDEVELAQIKKRTGVHLLDVQHEPAALRKRDGQLALDLNAIAPGYAVDRLCELLERLGARDYLVDIGGEIRVRGVNAQREAWRIAIEDPAASERKPHTFIELTEGATATSGGYRHFREMGGERYSHVLDARTGRPAASRIGAVAVIAPTALQADAWATALYALGFDEGMQVSQERKLAAMFLTFEGRRVVSHSTPEFDLHRAR